VAHLPRILEHGRHKPADRTATKSQRELLKQLEQDARNAARDAEKAAKKAVKTPVSPHVPIPGKGNKHGTKHTGTTGTHRRLGTGSQHNTAGAQGLTGGVTGGVTGGTAPTPNHVHTQPAPHPTPRPSHHPTPRPQPKPIPKPTPKPTSHERVLPPLADRNDLALQSPGVLAMLAGLALVVLAAMGYVVWSGRRGRG
jgi:hypothetical protein